MKKSRIIAIFLIVMLDLIGFGLILPLLPFYAETYAATPFIVGLLTSSYAAAQFIGAPLLGRLSDRIGRRPVLIISLLGTLIGYIILGFANALWMLFLTRLLDGFSGGNISVAQAYITDITDEKDRAKSLGLIGAAFGLGFVIGPAIGGLLSVYGYAIPSFVAAGLSLISILAAFFFLPESLSPEVREQLAHKKKEEFSLVNLRVALSRPKIGPLLNIRFWFGFSQGLFQTAFPLFAQYSLGLDARGTGLLLAYVGIIIVLVQGVAIGKLTDRFSENKLILWAAAGLAGIYLGWAFSGSIALVMIVLAPLSLAVGILTTVVPSRLSKVVTSEEVGGALGLAASLESLTRVFAPTVGGYIFGLLGAWSPGVLAAVIMAGLYFFSRFTLVDQSADQ